tara:strand:+ start:31 stop:933 length:903 start_codon:yes stop_codon:yes gene_type:complete
MRIGTVPIGRQQLLAHLMARLAQKLGAASHASAAALAIVALSFAAAPSLLPPTAWRLVLGMNGAVLLLLLPMEHVLAELRRRSEPTFPSPPCSPASEVFECPSCRKPCTGEHGFRIHLGHRPSCKRAWLARHIGRVAPAAPPVDAVSAEAKRELFEGCLRGAVSASLATQRVDKLVGGTVVGDFKDAVRSWLTLIDTELRRELSSRSHTTEETLDVISRSLHVFNGLETEAQEVAHLKRPIDQGGAGTPYLQVKARLLGERTVFGRRTRVGPRRNATRGRRAHSASPLSLSLCVCLSVSL